MTTSLLVLAPSAQAAPVLQISGGQLMGAAGVVVGGQAYDVLFKDGSCQTLFAGCDQSADFAFQSESAATAAALALFDQVFVNSSLGQFDAAPKLTNGCTHLEVCSVWMPYAPQSGNLFKGLFASNRDKPGYYGDDAVTGNINWDVSWNSSNESSSTWAVWSKAQAAQVPEPSSFALAGVAFAALALARRRRGG